MAEFLEEVHNSQLRQDMITFLIYIGQGELTLTQASKNLSLKDIRAINDLLTSPAELDWKIGNKTYKLRNEQEAEQIYYLDVLARVGDLVKIRRRKMSLTARSRDFLQWTALSQLTYLFEVWWRKTNWAILYPYQNVAEDIQVFNLPLAKFFSIIPQDLVWDFSQFASLIIESCELEWESEADDSDQFLLEGAVEKVLLYPLEIFGVVRVRYRKDESGYFKKPVSFQMTKFGKNLLEEFVNRQMKRLMQATLEQNGQNN